MQHFKAEFDSLAIGLYVKERFDEFEDFDWRKGLLVVFESVGLDHLKIDHVENEVLEQVQRYFDYVDHVVTFIISYQF